MTRPATEAGRKLVEPNTREEGPNRAAYHLERCGIWGLRPCDCGLADDVLAIEQETRGGYADLVTAARLWHELLHPSERTCCDLGMALADLER